MKIELELDIEDRDQMLFARQFLTRIAQALEKDGTLINTKASNNIEHVHSWSQLEAVGHHQQTTKTIEVDSPDGLILEATDVDAPEFQSYDNEDLPLNTKRDVVTVEELDEDHECPCCLELFDRDLWDDLGGAHDQSGGYTVYGCPNDCDGEIEVLI